MSEKRKDNKGRILRTGESQRKGLIYQYRYTDIRSKQQTVYSSDLKELREKEKEIQKQLDDGIDYLPENLRRVTVICVGFRHNSNDKNLIHLPRQYLKKPRKSLLYQWFSSLKRRLLHHNYTICERVLI